MMNAEGRHELKPAPWTEEDARARNASAAATMVECRRAGMRVDKDTMQGGQVARHGVHIPEIAGSTPAPAPNSFDEGRVIRIAGDAICAYQSIVDLGTRQPTAAVRAIQIVVARMERGNEASPQRTQRTRRTAK